MITCISPIFLPCNCFFHLRVQVAFASFNVWPTHFRLHFSFHSLDSLKGCPFFHLTWTLLWGAKEFSSKERIPWTPRGGDSFFLTPLCPLPVVHSEQRGGGKGSPKRLLRQSFQVLHPRRLCSSRLVSRKEGLLIAEASWIEPRLSIASVCLSFWSQAPLSSLLDDGSFLSLTVATFAFVRT